MADELANAEQLRLLVIDGNLGLSRVLSIGLADWRVATARTAADARRTLRAFQPDVILLDLALPDTDGLLLMIELKRTSHAPIVVYTTRDDPVDRALSHRLGAVDFIAKPVSVDELRGRLADAIHVSWRRQSLRVHQ